MADAILSKVCRRCSVEKPTSEFYARGGKNKHLPRSKCKACEAEIRAIDGGANAARAAAWRAADPERSRASCRKSRAKHVDARRASARERWQDPEYRAREIMRLKLRYRDRRELHIQDVKKSRDADPEKWKTYLREYVKNNPDKFKVYGAKRRAKIRAAGGEHTAEDIVEIRKMQRDKCACCKIGLKGRGAVDHIKPLARGGSNDRKNLQLLCKSCNSKKHAKDPIDFMQQQGFLL